MATTGGILGASLVPVSGFDLPGKGLRALPMPIEQQDLRACQRNFVKAKQSLGRKPMLRDEGTNCDDLYPLAKTCALSDAEGHK